MISWGRDFDEPPSPWGEPPRPGHPIRIYKWARRHEALAAGLAAANAYPRAEDHDAYPHECCWKVYEEVPAEPSTLSLARVMLGQRARELLIECKVCLTREDWAEGRYCAQLFPLRGTDLWPVIRLLEDTLGEPETMIHDGQDGLILWFTPFPPDPGLWLLPHSEGTARN